MPPEIHNVIKWRIADFSDIHRLATQFLGGYPSSVFRGQSNHSWGLESAIERNQDEFTVREFGLEKYEYRTVIEAQRRLHHYLQALPEPNDWLSWIALLRHYGVPTRLLDVTRSIYVACYFALRTSTPETDAAVWIFKRNPFHSGFCNWERRYGRRALRQQRFTIAEQGEYHAPMPKSNAHDIGAVEIDQIFDSSNPETMNFSRVIDAALKGHIGAPGVAIVEPYWLSKRMDAQQGSFLVPFDLRRSFQENLADFLDLEPSQDLKTSDDEMNVPDANGLRKAWFGGRVYKVRLPASTHGAIKGHLKHMNITEQSLFPDLEGAMAQISGFVGS